MVFQDIIDKLNYEKLSEIGIIVVIAMVIIGTIIYQVIKTKGKSKDNKQHGVTVKVGKEAKISKSKIASINTSGETGQQTDINVEIEEKAEIEDSEVSTLNEK